MELDNYTSNIMAEPRCKNKKENKLILFYSILFYSILFYSILFYTYVPPNIEELQSKKLTNVKKEVQYTADQKRDSPLDGGSPRYINVENRTKSNRR